MGTYSDEKPRLRYFVPDEFIVLTEHSDDLKVADIAQAVWESKLIQDNIIYEENDGKVLRKPVITENNILTLKFDNRALERQSSLTQPFFKNLAGGRTSFSLVFVNVEAPEGEVPKIINKLSPLLRSSETKVQPDADRQLTIVEVTPNWLLSSAPAQEGGGGPGKRPVPPANSLGESQPVEAMQPAKAASGGTATKREFHDYKEAVAAHPSATKDREVDIIILDTAPSCAAYEHAQKALPDNERLQALAKQLHIYHAAELSIDLPTNYQIRDHNYKMSDHGLFVASILNEHAPYARLHVLQVLNDYGIGTIKTILGGLLSLYHYKPTDLKPPLAYNPLSEERRAQKCPVVINLSLVLDLPRPECKGKSNEPILEHHRTDLNWTEMDNLDFVEQMGWPLEVVLEWVFNEFYAQGVGIVAAAGNDGSEKQIGPDGKEKTIRRIARYPAAYKTVIGIGAKGKTDDPTEYTNLSDEPTKDGYLVFGGEPDENDTIYTDPENGVLGVYIGDFPRAGDINKYGLAMWAGTSFACPRFAASLADTLRRGLGPDEADALAKQHSVPNAYGERILS